MRSSWSPRSTRGRARGAKSARGSRYEQARSIEAFLSKYIPDVIHLGYWNAPDEVDARAHENEGESGSRA